MGQQEKRAFKNHLYEQFARIGKALSSAHRLELLEVLAQGEHILDVRPAAERAEWAIPESLYVDAFQESSM